MTNGSPTGHDPPDTPQEYIADTLRRRITRGGYAPNQMMPTRRDLADEFGVALATVQRALESLRQEGFVEGRRRVGTWVNPHPPHLWHVGLVFPRHPDGRGHWSRFWSALIAAAERVETAGPHGVRRFFLEDGEAHSDADALASMVADRRLAGVIAVGAQAAKAVSEIPDVGTPQVPCVAIKDGPRHPGINAMVEVDPPGWLGAALAEVARHGCRAPAVLTHQPTPADVMEPAAAYGHAHGFEIGPGDVLQVNPHNATWARHGAHALLRGDPAHWPDALLITDDHLLEPATSGLAEVGVAVPDALRVVGLTNFDAWEPAQVPVTRLGFDSDEVLSACLEQLTRLRAGEAVEAQRRVEPRFDPVNADADTPASR